MTGINFWSGGFEYIGIVQLSEGWWICYQAGDPGMQLVLRKATE